MSKKNLKILLSRLGDKMDGEFQRYNSRLDDNIGSLFDGSHSNDNRSYWFRFTDGVWSYFALFVGMIILAVFFLTDERLGE